MMGILLFLLSLLLHLLLLLLEIVAVLLLLVLFVPFRYRLTGYREEETAAVEARVSWLLGLVSILFGWDDRTGASGHLMLFERWKAFRIDLSGDKNEGSSENAGSGKPKGTSETSGSSKTEGTSETAGSDKTEGKGESSGKSKTGGKPKKKRHIHLTLEKLLMLLDAALRVLVGLMPKRIRIDARFGFDDPGDTGMVCAALASMTPLFSGHPNRKQIRIRPVFDEETLEGSFFLEGRAILWFIVWEALKLAISRPFRQDIFPWAGPAGARKQGGHIHV